MTMTVLLVLMTLIVFLGIDYILQRRRARVLSAAMEQQAPVFSFNHSLLPADVVFAGNHVWLRREKDNIVTVGLDHLLAGLTGTMQTIELPAEKQHLMRGAKAVVLKERTTELRVPIPLEGEVVEVNTNLATNPGLAVTSPYENGWLFRLLPVSAQGVFDAFVGGEKAREWLKQQADRLKEFVLAHAPRGGFATMQDGGIPLDGVLKRFDENVWKEFEERFLQIETEPAQKGGGSHA
jgi:glycine cleavage system H protein